MENKNACQQQIAGPGSRDRISAPGGATGLPAAALALRLADLKRQLALRQAMA